MKRRLLNISDWAVIADNFTNIQTYMDGSALAIGDLQTRMSSAESGRTALEGRMTTAESTLTGHGTRITALETRFGSGKATSIAAITTNPTTPLVEVLGLSVAAGSGITTLRAAYIELRDAFNLLLTRSKSWGWMAT